MRGSDTAALTRQTVAEAVGAVFPFFGLGAEYAKRMDSLATAAVEEALRSWPHAEKLRRVSSEGPRDGSPPISLPGGGAPSGLSVFCDPLDGTLNGARGGPRCYSVLALSTQLNPLDAACADDQAVISLGSNSWDVTCAFDESTLWENLVREHLHDRCRLSATLHRRDNLALFRDLGATWVDEAAIGSKSGYQPTLLAAGILAVGDATVTLPWECDLELGRMGLTEVQIQAGLYRSWCGLLVSREKILRHPAGSIGYLRAYIQARNWGDGAAISGLFTAAEISRFTERGVALVDVVQPLAPDRFGIGRQGLVCIAALSSPSDPLVRYRPGILENPVLQGDDGFLLVDVRTRAGFIDPVNAASGDSTLPTSNARVLVRLNESGAAILPER